MHAGGPFPSTSEAMLKVDEVASTQLENAILGPL